MTYVRLAAAAAATAAAAAAVARLLLYQKFREKRAKRGFCYDSNTIGDCSRFTAGPRVLRVSAEKKRSDKKARSSPHQRKDRHIRMREKSARQKDNLNPYRCLSPSFSSSPAKLGNQVEPPSHPYSSLVPDRLRLRLRRRRENCERHRGISQ